MTPRVLDIYHGDSVVSLKDVAGAGIWGVIHKATEAAGITDHLYHARRLEAAGAGLLWGAYHFGSSDDVLTQVERFLAYAQPDEKTLMCLDFEDRDHMSIHQAVDFLRLLEQKLGRKAAVYGGNRIKEHLSELSHDDKAYFASHRLWLCQYGPHAVVPPPFTKPWLWQYTDGEINHPQAVPGMANMPDLSSYDGPLLQLISEWP